MHKNIRIYIDMDNVLCNYNKAYDIAIKKEPKIIYPQSQYGFFLNLEPIEDATDSYRILSEDFDVWILTAPSEKNPFSYTEKRVWVEKFLGEKAVGKLIISPNKSLLIGDYLIDDIKEGKAKQNEFTGKLLHFGSKAYPDWFSILKYFNLKYK